MKDHIAFELLDNEIDFLKPQLLLFRKMYSDIPILLIVSEEKSREKILQNYPEIKDVGKFCIRKDLETRKYPFVRIFITSEQYSNGIESIPSYCSFHGQPSKGMTLMHGYNKNFKGFLTLGPFQKEYISSYFSYHQYLKKPILYDVGYPKSDQVINSDIVSFDKKRELNDLGLSDLPTILYAPAFNEYASMRESGVEIVDMLLSSGKYNVIVKLAVDCWKPASYLYANGGIDWFGEFERQFGDNPRFHLYKHRGIDPLLPLADILITCVSSVSFEFLVLGKPVVFIDTPKFFSKYLRKFFPNENTSLWENNSFVNGGREYGLLVKDIKSELNDAVEKSLMLSPSEETKLLMRERFLFNPGRGAEATVKLLKTLYDDHPIFLRTKIKIFLADTYIKYVKNSMPYKGIRCIFDNFNQCFTQHKAIKRTYIHCEKTVEAAKLCRLTINDYLEQNENTPLKIGHRTRILEHMKKYSLLDIQGKNVLEIGSGTARFLEKIIQCEPNIYVVYETDEAWSAYTQKTYGAEEKIRLIVNVANGSNLNKTRNETMDVVYAHGVFVYLPFVTAVGYLKEISRVCKSGGLVCLDWYYDTDWNMEIIEANEHFGNRWPVVVSRNLIEQCYEELGFVVIGEFTEIYSCSFSRYVILRKK